MELTERERQALSIINAVMVYKLQGKDFMWTIKAIAVMLDTGNVSTLQPSNHQAVNEMHKAFDKLVPALESVADALISDGMTQQGKSLRDLLSIFKIVHRSNGVVLNLALAQRAKQAGLDPSKATNDEQLIDMLLERSLENAESSVNALLDKHKRV